MRTIEFADVKEYELAYEVVLVAHTAGAEARIHGKVLDKFEKIGTPLGTKGLYTLAGANSIALEDAEFEFVKKYVESTELIGSAIRTRNRFLDKLLETKPDPI